ncbi:MAG: thiamine biosynthesis protein ThiS [Sulfobacillus thermosulfidooxidans]|uniref:Thiamine biosynthesis protein ThiS n=1 Tax=Sulfobacillus thermotolerans TaxID=338644 RepID=A0ABN5GYY4_9FIRM|nr:sulfur carrier protein ThiS [Sulfobacillus sp. hq2]AUW93359.1 hypothetical protein BXT84_04815 [Sulfobacillus thermotolerans]MCY0908556.1 sulfur carrier protein ThiS [Sulfobacillus thermotolerans]POB10592.1 thiamine biosynthesis protein ThiS [Sulfobacillus sp. hq2]PSR36522.1 MAG: thiamine biosynthesis protein ThiS [Sulfobacillus thermosulfidooxidans]
MTLILNGKEFQTRVRTLDQLLAELALSGDMVVVLWFGEIIPSTRRSHHPLQDGDHIQIAAFYGQCVNLE